MSYERDLIKEINLLRRNPKGLADISQELKLISKEISGDTQKPKLE